MHRGLSGRRSRIRNAREPAHDLGDPRRRSVARGVRNVIIPWHWNLHSALLEVSVCITAYVAIFLLYENLPAVLPKRWFDRIKPLYPYRVAAAFLLPAMHQSSLGSLMVIAGTKVHPLWQTQMLPASI